MTTGFWETEYTVRISLSHSLRYWPKVVIANFLSLLPPPSIHRCNSKFNRNSTLQKKS